MALLCDCDSGRAARNDQPRAGVDRALERDRLVAIEIDFDTESQQASMESLLGGQAKTSVAPQQESHRAANKGSAAIGNDECTTLIRHSGFDINHLVGSISLARALGYLWRFALPSWADLKAEPRSVKRRRADRSIGDVEHAGESLRPFDIAGRAVLAAVPFDRGDRRQAGRQAGRVEE
ncbi:hypothetical protein Enr8_32860 [Blastopirellula retiformator]|uniref:Uncharacterized protein n=1 Tax=Blastopirellula retiformator TaxID=2527970 RepID=A0A5C5V0X1_9BACT|nr:hypothetical protein Enr8_32860 [Blastopirellula retiformator]